MPINFTELVGNIEAKNKQNRAELASKVAPFLDVLTRKSMYDAEKRKAADEAVAGYSAMAETMGGSFSPLTVDGKPASPETQGRMFSAQMDAQAPVKQMEAMASVYGVQLPENYKSLKPQEANLKLAELREDHAASQAINDMLVLYPEITQKVVGDPAYQSATTRQRVAMVNKALGDEAARSKFNETIATHAAKSAIDTQKYWQTTGANAAMNRDAAAAGSAGDKGLSESAKTARDTVKMYETSGKSVGGTRVKINNSKGYREAIATVRGEQIRKTSSGYSYWDAKSNKWRKLDIDKDDKNTLVKKIGGVAVKNQKYPNAVTILTKALDEYDTSIAKSRTSGESAPAQTLSTQDDEFGDLF
jgi:hypothetical protein